MRARSALAFSLVLCACAPRRSQTPVAEAASPPRTETPAAEPNRGPPPTSPTPAPSAREETPPSTPPPTPTFTLPAELVLAVGAAAIAPAHELLVSVLSVERRGAEPRARVRIAVAHGDHEVDLVGTRAIDLDGFRIRLLRLDDAGHAVLAVSADTAR